MIAFDKIKIGDNIGGILKHKTFIGKCCYDANTIIFFTVLDIPDNIHQLPQLKVKIDGNSDWERVYDYYFSKYMSN